MKDFHPQKIKIIGFDADDTLWINEPFYRETEEKFCELLTDFAPPEKINRVLYSVEMDNMELYGYGTKAFMLSLIETAVRISEGKVPVRIISRIIELGKEQIALKNTMLPGVTEVLELLSKKYRLIVATKGDLLDQERKLRSSGLSGYFHHIEIMTGKKEENYMKLLHHLDINASEFLMIGNSIPSDILPVTRLGGYAIHVPFHITWEHEKATEHEAPDGRFLSVGSISEVPVILDIKWP